MLLGGQATGWMVDLYQGFEPSGALLKWHPRSSVLEDMSGKIARHVMLRTFRGRVRRDLDLTLNSCVPADFSLDTTTTTTTLFLARGEPPRRVGSHFFAGWGGKRWHVHFMWRSFAPGDSLLTVAGLLHGN